MILGLGFIALDLHIINSLKYVTLKLFLITIANATFFTFIADFMNHKLNILYQKKAINKIKFNSIYTTPELAISNMIHC